MQTFIRAILALLLLLIVGGLANWAGFPRHAKSADPNASAAANGAPDWATARSEGVRIRQTAVMAAGRLDETMKETAITAKIKAKMALDDSVKARAIHVSTHGSTVTLGGTVRSVDEYHRAMDLVHETAGVSRVDDKLMIQLRVGQSPEIQ
jgi:osmotically-inducible protein OsmY